MAVEIMVWLVGDDVMIVVISRIYALRLHNALVEIIVMWLVVDDIVIAVIGKTHKTLVKITVGFMIQGEGFDVCYHRTLLNV